MTTLCLQDYSPPPDERAEAIREAIAIWGRYSTHLTPEQIDECVGFALDRYHDAGDTAAMAIFRGKEHGRRLRGYLARRP